MTESRITGIRPETINSGSGSRVTLIRPEVIHGATGAGSRVTLLRPEIAWAQNPRSRISTARIEIMRPYAGEVVTPSDGSAQLFPRGSARLPGTGSAILEGAVVGGIDVSGTYPDALSVIGLKGLPMVGTLGANQVWTKDPAAAQLIPTTPGAPTVKYQIYDPFIPDASPHSLTAEFDTTSLAAFTLVYITGETGVTVDANTTVPGWLWMKLPHQQYRMRAAMKALPGDSTWTIHTCVIATYPAADGGYPGLVLSNGDAENAGKQTSASISFINGYGKRLRLTWDGFGNTASGAASDNEWQRSEALMFIRVRKLAGTLYRAFSPDGLHWMESTFTMFGGVTETHFGVQAQNYTGVNDVQVGFGYLRYYPTTQLLTGGLRNVYA